MKLRRSLSWKLWTKFEPSEMMRKCKRTTPLLSNLWWMPNLVRKPPFGFNPVAPMPVPVSAPPFLNRSFSSHHPSFSHSPSGAPSTGLKCHQCFLVLDGPASLNSHMETFHGRVASDAADASVGIEGDVKCKNCDLSFPSVIELGRHIAKDGCWFPAFPQASLINFDDELFIPLCCYLYLFKISI